MTGHADYSTWDFAKLQQMHSLLSEALRKTHEAWELERSVTGSAANYYAELADLIYRDSTQVYEALRSHPDHPLNEVHEVPLADDTAPVADMPKHSKLSDYRAWLDHNTLVMPGAELQDHHGDTWVFDRISVAPGLGSSGKVQVHNDQGIREFYPSVFNLIIT